MRVLKFVVTRNRGFTKPAKQANAKKKIYNKKQIIKTQSWNRNSLTERHYLCVFKKKKKKRTRRGCIFCTRWVPPLPPIPLSATHLAKLQWCTPLCILPTPCAELPVPAMIDCVFALANIWVFFFGGGGEGEEGDLFLYFYF